MVITEIGIAKWSERAVQIGFSVQIVAMSDRLVNCAGIFPFHWRLIAQMPPFRIAMEWAADAGRPRNRLARVVVSEPVYTG